MAWAPLIGPERYDSESTRAVGYDFLEPTLLQSLAAGVGEELADYGPTGAVMRVQQMEEALGAPVQTYGNRIDNLVIRPRTPVSKEQWEGSADFRPGLTYFDGMTAEAAKVLAERFDIRAKRSDVLNRTEGVAVNSAVFAARFASQLVDPIGLAANFVPVVSQARYARLLAQLGRPGARAVTGLVEGAVGNALLEPLIYSAAQRDQLDYDMVDSLANVGMGAVFGAGLRTVGGAVVDALARRGGRAVAAAADTAITQAAMGREIDVAPVLRAEDARPQPAAGITGTEVPGSSRQFPADAEPEAAAPTQFRDGGSVFVKPIVDSQGKRVGTISGSVSGDTFRVYNSGIDDPAAMGKGYGIRSYVALLNEVLASGKKLVSDAEVTADAARVYDGLKRRGYAVKRAETAKFSEETGKWTNGRAPVFEVTGKAEADPTARLLEERRAAEREQVRQAREYLRRGREEDASRPMTFAQRRVEATKALEDAYPSREIQMQAADRSGGFFAPTGKSVTRKGPMDLATFVRVIGGVRDDAGELRGIDTKPRAVQFAKGEGFIGGLIKKDGLTLEAATRAAADAGYIGRTVESANEYGERGISSTASTDEFVQALERTIAAGDSMEGRVFGVDDDGPVQDYIRTMREIDEEEAFSPAGADRWMPLRDEDLAADEEMGFDPIDLEGADDPEALWREEMEREAAMKAEPAEQPATRPAAEGEPKPLTPEQQIELDAENYRAGIQAAAACMGRAL